MLLVKFTPDLKTTGKGIKELIKQLELAIYKHMPTMII